MELKETIRINARRDQVYAALNDAAILRQAIPGCEDMQRLSPTEFAATVVSRVGPMKVTFKGGVTLSDLRPPESYTLTGEGKGGAAGFARMRARVELAEDGAATVLSYEVKADVGGKLAQLGGRLIEATSKKIAAEFFGNFEKIVSTPIAVESATPPPAAVANSKVLLWIVYAALVVAAAAVLSAVI